MMELRVDKSQYLYIFLIFQSVSEFNLNESAFLPRCSKCEEYDLLNASKGRLIQ